MEDDGAEAFEESFFPTSDWVVRRLQQKHDPAVAERVLNIYLWGSRYRILLFIYLFCLFFVYIFLTFFSFLFAAQGVWMCHAHVGLGLPCCTYLL